MQASIRLRKVGERVDALCKSTPHPRILEVKRRVDGLRADVRRKVSA